MERRSVLSEIKIDLKKAPTFNVENISQDKTQIITTTNLISTEDGQLIPRNGTLTIHTLDLSQHPELKDASIIYSGFITNNEHILLVTNSYTEIAVFDIVINITDEYIQLTSNISALQKPLISATKIKLTFTNDGIVINTLILDALTAHITSGGNKTQLIFKDYQNKQYIYSLSTQYDIYCFIETTRIYIIDQFRHITPIENKTSWGDILAASSTCDILRENDNELLISLSSLGICLISWDDNFNFQLKDLITEYKLELQSFRVAKQDDNLHELPEAYASQALCVVNFSDINHVHKQYLLMPIHPKYPLFQYQKNSKIEISIVAIDNNTYSSEIPITNLVTQNIQFNRYIPETILPNPTQTAIFTYLAEHPEWNYNHLNWNGKPFLVKNQAYTDILDAVMAGNAPARLYTVYYNSQISVGQNFGSAYFLAEADEEHPQQTTLQKLVFQYKVNPEIEPDLSDYQRLALFFNENATYIRTIGTQNSIQITSVNFELIIVSENTTIRRTEQPIPLIRSEQIREYTTQYVMFDITGTSIANVTTQNIAPQDTAVQNEDNSCFVSLHNIQYFPISKENVNAITLKIPPPPLGNLFKAHGFVYGITAAKIKSKNNLLTTITALFKTTEKNDGKSWFNINTGNYNSQELNAPYFYTTSLNLDTNNLPHSLISFYNYLLIISTSNIQIWQLNTKKEDKKNADTLVEKYLDTLTIGATNKDAIFKTGSSILVPSNTQCNLLTINTINGYPDTVGIPQFNNLFTALNSKYQNTLQFRYENIENQHLLFCYSALDSHINETIIFKGQITQTSQLTTPRISYFNKEMFYIKNTNINAPNNLFISNSNHQTLDIIRLSDNSYTDDGKNIECNIIVKIKAPKKIWRNESIEFSYSSLSKDDITAKIEVINVNGAPPPIRTTYTLTKSREILPGQNGALDLLFGVSNKHTYQTMLPAIFEEIILKINISTSAKIFIENLSLYGISLN